MKTSETGGASKFESTKRPGMYLGIALAGAAGLGLGLAGNTAWQRLSISPAQPTTMVTGATDKASGAVGHEPSAAEKSVFREAFAEAFGPPAGLPTGLTQAATELPTQEIPSITMAQAQVPVQANVPAIKPGIRPKAQDVAPLAALTPMMIRHVGPDGLERIGVDFDLSIPSNPTNQIPKQAVQQAGFFIPSIENPNGDGKQSGGGAGGMAKIGPSSQTVPEKGTLGSQEPEPLIGSFTTEYEDGYLKLPEELAGWVVEGKVFIAPGPDGSLRMATLEDLETMFGNENEPPSNRGGEVSAREQALALQEMRRNMRRFYGLMTACVPEEDEEGNLWIPLGDQIARQAGLKGEVVIAGMRTHAEIWSKARWEAELVQPKGPEAPKPLELQKVEIRSKANTQDK